MCVLFWQLRIWSTEWPVIHFSFLHKIQPWRRPWIYVVKLHVNGKQIRFIMSEWFYLYFWFYRINNLLNLPFPGQSSRKSNLFTRQWISRNLINTTSTTIKSYLNWWNQNIVCLLTFICWILIVFRKICAEMASLYTMDMAACQRPYLDVFLE